MNGETALKIIEALKTAKTVMPLAIVAGFVMLLAFGIIQPTGDPLDDDAAVL